MTTYPNPAAIEAGARALYESNPSRIYDEAAGLITGTKPWDWMTPEYQDAKRAEAAMMYRAMAPLIRAQELRDFAEFISSPSSLGVDISYLNAKGALGLIAGEAQALAFNIEADHQATAEATDDH